MSPQSPPQAPLRPVLIPGLLGLAIFAGALFAAVYQMARSNRPHELTLAPLVTLIQLVAVGLFSLAALRLARALRQRHKAPVGKRHWICLVLLVPLGVAALTFLIGAASTAVDIVRG